MAQSVVKLTLESNQYEQGLRKAQRQLSDFTSKIGVNMKALTGMAVAAGAVTTAMKVMKDAFMSSETAIDEWGRTVQSAHSLYDSFLSALNNADISGFLARMDDIVSAARAAYDAMDELGTYSAFNQRNVAKGRAGYAAALDAYKLNPTAENKQALANANQQVLKDLRDSHQKTEDAYQAALKNLATTRLSSKELQDAFVKTFSEGSYGDLVRAKASYSTGRGLASGAQYFYGDRVYDGRIKSRDTNQWRDMTDDEKKRFEFARALSQVKDEQIKEIQALGAQSVAIQEQISNQNRQYNRLAGNNASRAAVGGGGRTSTTRRVSAASPAEVLPEGSVAQLTQAMRELRKEQDKVTNPAAWQEYEKRISEISYLINGIKYGSSPLSGTGLNLGNMGISLPTREDIIKRGQQQIQRFQGYKPDKKATDGEKIAQMAGGISQMTGGISSIAGGIEQLGIELPRGLKEIVNTLGGIATIVGGISSAVTAAAVLSSIPFFANGGIAHAANGLFVPGHSYSGDRVPAMLNSGELVLNKAQQGNLASQLSGGALGNLNLTARVQGSDLILAIDNTNKSAGKGKMMTMRFNHNG